MKNSVKIFGILLALIMLLSTFTIFANAATGSSVIACETELKVGETFVVTVTLKGPKDTVITSAAATFSYPADKLEFVSCQNGTNDSSGKVSINISGDGAYLSANITFKVISEGNAVISLGDCTAKGSETYSVTGSSVPLKIGSGSSTSSSSADLKSLVPEEGTLEPEFSPEITEYTVVVPYEKTSGVLTCAPKDPKAKFEFGGEKELAVGITKRYITVTAADGTQKVYYVTFNRLDENGNDTTVVSEGATVNVDGITYKITSDFGDLKIPNGMSRNVTDYGGEEVSCIADQSGNSVAICLVNTVNNQKQFFLLGKDGNLSVFVTLESNENVYIVLPSEESFTIPDGFYATTYEIDSKIISAYKYTDEKYSEFIIVRAQMPNEDPKYYRYDTKEKTVQKYTEFTSGSFALGKTDDVVPQKRKTLIILLLFLAVEILIAIIVLAIIMAVNYVKGKNEDFEDFDIDMDTDLQDDLNNQNLNGNDKE